MSKSLGNSPDPLELISKYGADGLRFGLLRIAPHGQDIRFDEKQIEEGRNFANKLWNACRFRQLQGPTALPGQYQVSGGSLPAEGEWSPYSAHIITRLNEAISRIEASYADYLFTDVAQALYDFFWSEFCDRYLEAAKAELQSSDTAVRAGCLAVIDHVLSTVLKLLHPFMPHITEELWSRMGFGAGSIQFAPITDLSVKCSGQSSRVEFAEKVYQASGITRNLRAEYRVASNRKTRIILKPSSAGAQSESIDSSDFEVFARLVNAQPFEVDPNFEPKAGIPFVVTQLGEVFLPLEGLVDLAAERERLGKELARLESELETVRKKLSNENFVKRAPGAVVEEHRRRELEFVKQLERLRERLAVL
jgi:valyl-tRNA synthetase